MVSLIFKRTDIGYPEEHIISRNEPLDKALELLIIYDIGYGGSVKKFGENGIRCVTQVMGKLDTDTYESTDSEEFSLMEEASDLANAYENLIRNEDKDTSFRDLVKITNGNPLLISMGIGLLTSMRKVKFILIAMCKPTSESQIESLSSMNNRDLLALMNLIRIDKIQIEEAMTVI